MIAVSCALTSISDELIRLAREKFVKLGGEISPEKIFIGAIHNHTAFGYGGVASWNTKTILRYRVQQEKEIFPIETHIIRLGDVAMATNPFELFLDYGNRMKARSKASQTFIFQLTGGQGGYLPTEKAERSSHYSAYISSGNVGHEGGDLLVRRTVKEINEMFD